MEVAFAQSDLALLETEDAAETGLPVFVIRAARLRLNVMRAAPDESTLSSWKSLRFHRCSRADGANAYIILEDSWRMWVRLDTTTSPNRVHVLEASCPENGSCSDDD